MRMLPQTPNWQESKGYLYIYIILRSSVSLGPLAIVCLLRLFLVSRIMTGTIARCANMSGIFGSLQCRLSRSRLSMSRRPGVSRHAFVKRSHRRRSGRASNSTTRPRARQMAVLLGCYSQLRSPYVAPLQHITVFIGPWGEVKSHFKCGSQYEGGAPQPASEARSALFDKLHNANAPVARSTAASSRILTAAMCFPDFSLL